MGPVRSTSSSQVGKQKPLSDPPVFKITCFIFCTLVHLAFSITTLVIHEVLNDRIPNMVHNRSPGGSVVACLLTMPRVCGLIPTRIFHPKIITFKTILRHYLSSLKMFLICFGKNYLVFHRSYLGRITKITVEYLSLFSIRYCH